MITRLMQKMTGTPIRRTVRATTVRYGVAAAVALGLSVAATQAQAPTLAESQAALKAATAKADEMGVPMGCTVVDARGAIVAVARMDDAPFFTSDVAAGKARVSAAFGSKSADLMAMGSAGLDSVINGGGPMSFLPGAVPIVKDGRRVGAIGCSGAPDGQQDEDAAKAGLDAMM